MNMMQAVIFEKFGEPSDVLQLRDVDVPEPKRGQVQVRMLASPINPSDLLTIRGSYGKLPNLPATPGFEGVGIVESNGGGMLGKFVLGKRVCVLNSETGNWCERTIVAAKQAIPLPDDLALEQAAMFFVNPAAAYVMTRRVLRIPAGHWLLQTAAGSALGRMVIRLGRRYGFRTLNVVRREHQVAELQQLGGDRVVAFDPQHQDQQLLLEQVRQATGTHGVPYAIDPVGGSTGSAVVPCLGRNGRLLVYGTLTNDPLALSPRDLMTGGASIEGFWLAPWMAKQSLLGKLRLIKTITRLIRQGILSSDVGDAFELQQVVEAAQAAETSGRSGKVLLLMNQVAPERARATG